MQRQRAFGLRSTVWECVPVRGTDCFKQPMMCSTVHIQRVHCLRQKLHGMRIECRCDKFLTGSTGIISLSDIERQPVAIVMTGAPDAAVSGSSAYIFDPFLHHGKMLTQEFLVTISLIELPRADHRRVRPCGAAAKQHGVFREKADIRDKVGNRTVLTLLRCHIAQPFCKETLPVKRAGNRTDGSLRVACPAKPLVLRNDFALLRDQHLLAAGIRPAEAPVFRRDVRIIRFAVVNVAEPDRTLGPLPAFIGRVFPRSVRAGQMQCCQQTWAVRKCLIDTGGNPSGEPALSERDGQLVFLAQQRRQGIGLHLQSRRIACPAGSEKDVPDPLPVQKRFIDAERGDFQCCCCAGERAKMLSENRTYFADNT